MYVGEHLAGLESCIRDQKNRVIMHVTRLIIRRANRARIAARLSSLAFFMT